MSRSRSGTGRAVVPAAIVGIGLSGFFDGILLHQVLQWHHLLSLVPGERFRDIGTQILADGLFHVLMYVVTAVGLWLLWHRRADLAADPAGWRSIVGGGLAGFGLWNVIDVALFHWLLGIHRIRVNVPDPLVYDLAWLGVLGLVPLALGWIVLRGAQAGSSGGATAAMGLAALALAGAAMAARPMPNSDTAVVFFSPGTSLGEAVNAAGNAGVPLVWMDPKGRMIAVSLAEPEATARLYAQGALLVTRSPVVAGCGVALKS